jgi:hypothetical protein
MHWHALAENKSKETSYNAKRSLLYQIWHKQVDKMPLCVHEVNVRDWIMYSYLNNEFQSLTKDSLIHTVYCNDIYTGNCAS